MRAGGNEQVWAFEEVAFRQNDEVARWGIVGLVPAMDGCDRYGVEKGLGVRANFGRWFWRCGFGKIESWQTVDLSGVKDRIGFEERVAPCVGCAGGGVGFVLGADVVIDADLGFFTAADLGAELFGLAVGHPVWRCVSVDVADETEIQGVDARIGFAVVAKRYFVAGFPGSGPRERSGFEFFDDECGDDRCGIARGAAHAVAPAMSVMTTVVL